MSHLRVVVPTDKMAQAGQVFSPEQVIPEVTPAPVDSIRTSDGDLIQLRCDDQITLVIGRFEHAQRILHLDRDQARRLVAELTEHLEHA